MMAKIDNEDDLKRQMRRRLVGAVALVTTLVLILPAILESTPKRSDQGLELRIPDKDKAGAFTSQMVVPESAPEITALPSPASAPVDASAVSPVAAIPAKPEPPHKPAPVKPAPAKPEHKAAAAAAQKAGFAVQVGAFANAASAKELQDKLHKQGWHAYTEKAGETVRVRIGTYPTHEAAEKVLHKLEAQGMHPAVVSEP